MGMSVRVVQLDWIRMQEVPEELQHTRASLVADGSREMTFEDRDFRELHVVLSCAKRGLERALVEDQVVPPSRVAKLAAELRAMPWEKLAGFHRPELMEALGFHDSSSEDLREYYEELQAVYFEAADRGNAIYLDTDA